VRPLAIAFASPTSCSEYLQCSLHGETPCRSSMETRSQIKQQRATWDRNSGYTVLLPWSKDRNVRTIDSASSRSVLVLRLLLLTRKLVESITDVRMPRFRKNLANQKPSYPASKQTTISAGHPCTWAALVCSRCRSPTSAAVSPPRTCRSFTRSKLGESTATSHVDLLNSMAA